MVIVELENYRKLEKDSEKVKGLMFLKKVEKRLVFVFKTDSAAPFHSFFCPDFDIIFLDKDNVVREFYEIRTPMIIHPRYRYRYVIETEPGFIKRYKVKEGDRINFK